MTTTTTIDWTKADFRDQDVKEAVKDALPHGSGIDAKWEIGGSGKHHVVFGCAYHGRNESGYYMHWTSFSVRVFRVQKDEWTLLKGPSAGQKQRTRRCGDIAFKLSLKAERWDFLYEAVYHALKEASIVTGCRYEVMDV